MFSSFRPAFLFVCAGLAALPTFTGCTEKTEEKSAEMYYQVRLVRTAAVELEHPSYDPTLPGYWLVGNDSIVQMARVKGVTQPKEFSFMLRTKAAATRELPSELDIFRVLTPTHRIVSKFNPKKIAPVDILSYREKKEGTEVVLVKSDESARYIRFERVGEYVKVTFTTEGMNLIGDIVTISWKELPPGKKSDSDHSAAEAEGWRRVL